jgi:hypothetical protein
MKHHYQVFIAVSVLFILIMIGPLQEKYTNTATIKKCKDVSDCSICSNTKIGNNYCYWDSVFNKCDIYTNTINVATICSKKKVDNTNLDISNNIKLVNTTEYDHKWLNTYNGGSSSEFKFSDNYKFTNPIANKDIDTINKADFKLYNYYWPLSEPF